LCIVSFSCHRHNEIHGWSNSSNPVIVGPARNPLARPASPSAAVVLAELATVAAKEAKSSGQFVIPGLGKAVKAMARFRATLPHNRLSCLLSITALWSSAIHVTADRGFKGWPP
jgi:hypothetical protein